MRPRRSFRLLASPTVFAAVIGLSHLAIAVSASQRNPAQSEKPAAEFHGWRTETFGAVIVGAGDGVRLGSTTGPGGMFFRHALAADVQYRLTIAGQSRSGQTTVRLTLGQSPPQWLPAPNGQKVLTFTGHDAVEVVVYSDTPYEYQLEDIKVEVCRECVQPTTFKGWQVEPYGAVDPAWTAGSMTLASAAKPGGAFYRKTIDPAKAYRLGIAGKALTGTTTVRLTVGGAEPRWFPAPDGAKQLTVSGSDSLEVVVYGDAAYSYRLETLTADECVTCLTDRQFASLILGEIPTLRDLLVHDRKAAARALLNWSANVVDLGLGDDVDVATSREYEIGAAEAYQELWSGAGAGTACGGFADFFAKVLPLFGFEAFTINFGYAGTPITHVTTVVVIEGEFYLLDPTFNGAYVDSGSGELLRLRELLLKSPGAPGYTFRTEPIARDLVFTAGTDAAASRLLSNVGFNISSCEPGKSSPAGGQHHVCRKVPYDARVLKDEWKDELSRLTLQWNDDLILNLMRHRVLSLSTAKPETRRQFLEALSGNGIPFGPL